MAISSQNATETTVDDEAILKIIQNGISRMVQIDGAIKSVIERAIDDGKKQKQMVVKDVAKELGIEYEKKGMDISTIASELVPSFQGHIGKTLIYEALEDKYKNAGKARNRKGKGKKPEADPTKEFVPPAEPTAAESEQLVSHSNDGHSHTEAGDSGGAVSSGPLGSWNPDKILTLDAFLPTVDEVISNAQKVEGGYFVKDDVFEKLVIARPRVAA